MLNAQFETKIAAFRVLHAHGSVLLNNAWDVMSARLAESVGSKAIVTTSAGVSWSLGFPDGHSAPRKLVMQNAAAIAESTRLPVSVDVENGLLNPGESMLDLVHDLISAGIVGINIEDVANGVSLHIEEGAERLRNLRDAASSENFNLFLNARIDAYLRGETTDPNTLIKRANAYLAVGADCIFIPGITDLAICRQIASSISGPLNIMALPQGPSAKELFEVGVTRVSAGSFLAESAYGHVLSQMRKFQENGRLSVDVATHLGYAQANAVMGNA